MALPLISAFINFLMKDQAAKVIMHLASVMTAGNITSLISGFLLKPARFIKALKGLSTKELLNLQTLVNNELKFRNGDLFKERAEVLKKWFPDKAKEIDSLLKNRGQFQDFWKKTKANKSLTKEQLAQYEEVEFLWVNLTMKPTSLFLQPKQTLISLIVKYGLYKIGKK